MTISQETANNMMDFGAYICCMACYRESGGVEPDFSWIEEYIRASFINYCEVEGIVIIETDGGESPLIVLEE